MEEYEEETFDSEAKEEAVEEEEDDETLIRDNAFKRGFEEEIEDPYEEKVAEEEY